MEGYRTVHLVVQAPRSWLEHCSSIDEFKEICITGLSMRARDLFNGVTNCCTPVFINYNDIRAKVYSTLNGYWLRRMDTNCEILVSSYLTRFNSF